MQGQKLSHDLGLVNFGVVNDNAHFAFEMSQEMRQERDEARSFDGAFVRLLEELSFRGDATDDRQFFPVGLGKDHGCMTTGGPGVAHHGLHADSHFIGPDDDFTLVYLFFLKLEAELPATRPTALFVVLTGVSRLFARKIPTVEGACRANHGRTRRHT